MFDKIRAAFASKKNSEEQVSHVGRLSFCERVSATPTSPYHLRVITEEGFKTGGGVPVLTICGYDLNRGWDVTEESYSVEDAFVKSQMWIANDFIHAPCRDCVAVLDSGVIPEPQPDRYARASEPIFTPASQEPRTR